jgi:hypothetical protein
MIKGSGLRVTGQEVRIQSYSSMFWVRRRASEVGVKG